MKHPIYLLLSLALLAPASAAQSQVRPAEASELRARSDPGLELLRAGGDQESPALNGEERAALRDAEAAHPELADLRAGDLGVIEVLLIVVLILLILKLL